MSEETASGWLRLTFADPTPVHEVRDALYGYLGDPDPYRLEGEPHLSLFGFTVPASAADAFGHEVAAFAEALGPRSVPIDGYHVYPSTRNPMVVALDAPIALDAVASPLADLLAAHGGRVRWTSAAPHVTLFVGGERGAELQWPRASEEVRQRLRTVVTGDGHGCAGRQGETPPATIADPQFELTARPPAIEWD